MQAKTQNLFKENEGFVATQFDIVKGDAKIPLEEVAPKFSGTQDYKPGSFALSSDFLSVLNSDKAVAAEIEKVISAELGRRVIDLEEKNKKNLQNRLSELQEVQRVEAESKRKEGLEQGIREGKAQADLAFRAEKEMWTAEVDQLKEAMKQWTDGLHKEKATLLKEHQVHWLELVSTLMKKFLVPYSGQVEAGIENWLNHQLDVFKREEKIKVLIPNQQFERLQKNGIETHTARLEFVKDSALKHNEFKIESKSGGVFFSAEDQVQRLEQIIKNIFTPGE